MMSTTLAAPPVYCLISDCHGAFHTLIRLLNAVPKPCQLILLGDEIDRGPHSRKVVEFAMQNAIPTCAGNHADLCVAFYRNSRAHCHHLYDRGVWLDNGGDVAVTNWNTLDKRGGADIPGWEMRRDESIGGRVPDDVLDWMEGLPAYILGPEDLLDENGKRALFSHTGYGLDADKGNWYQALWGRFPCGDGPFATNDEGAPIDDGLYRVFGHSLTKTPVVTNTYAWIDCGAAYGKRGYGNLTALLWPSKQVITVPYDETPVKPTFRVSSGGCITDK